MNGGVQVATLSRPPIGLHLQTATRDRERGDHAHDAAGGDALHEFTSQEDLGNFLVKHYDIRNPRELTSCEICHR